MNKLIYLASPYSHIDPAVQDARYKEVFDLTMHLMNMGLNIFSPIVYSHQFAVAGMQGDFDAWRRFDELMIDKSNSLWVLLIDGWKESVGCQYEIAYALSQDKVVSGIKRIEFYSSLKNNDVLNGWQLVDIKHWSDK